MTTTTVQTLTVVKHLAHGRDVAFAAAATHLNEEEVRRIGEEHGYPDAVRLGVAAEKLAERVREDASALPEAEYAARRPGSSSAANTIARHTVADEIGIVWRPAHRPRLMVAGRPGIGLTGPRDATSVPDMPGSAPMARCRRRAGG